MSLLRGKTQRKKLLDSVEEHRWNRYTRITQIDPRLRVRAIELSVY